MGVYLFYFFHLSFEVYPTLRSNINISLLLFIHTILDPTAYLNNAFEFPSMCTRDEIQTVP